MPNYVTNLLSIHGDKTSLDELTKMIKGEEFDFDFNKIIPMPESLNLCEGGDKDRAIVAFLTDNCTKMLTPELAKKCQAYGVENMFDHEYLFAVYAHAQKEIAENGVNKTYSFASSGPDGAPHLTLYDAGRLYVSNIEAHGSSTWYYWRLGNWGTKWNSCDAHVTREGDADLFCYFDTAWSTPLPIFQKLAEQFPTLTIKLEYADEDVGSNCGWCVWENQTFTHWEPEKDGDESAIRYACNVLGFDAEEFLQEE